MVTRLFIGDMSQKFGSLMSNLWNDPNTKNAYELMMALPKTNTTSPLQKTLLDSAEYFLDSLGRLSALEYVPSDEDLLRYDIRMLVCYSYMKSICVCFLRSFILNFETVLS